MPVKVTGTINKRPIKTTIEDGKLKVYKLGIGVSKEQIVVALGSETGNKLKGLDYSILGAPFIFINHMIQNINIKEGTIVEKEQYLKVVNTLNRENYVEANYYETSAGRNKNF